MTIAVGDILRVVAVFVWNDAEVLQNVFNAEIVGAGGPFDEDDIVDDALAWVNTMFDELDANMSDELNTSEVRVYVYDVGDDDWDEIGSENWNLNLTAADDQLPRGVALLINAKTVDPDVNGKKYLGGYTEAAVTDGLFTAGEIARGVLFGAEWAPDFVGATSGASWDPGIWSPTNLAFYGMSGTLILPATPAYQRRRKQGVGI